MQTSETYMSIEQLHSEPSRIARDTMWQMDRWAVDGSHGNYGKRGGDMEGKAGAKIEGRGIVSQETK